VISSSSSYCYAQEMSLILPHVIAFLSYAYMYVILEQGTYSSSMAEAPNAL